MSFDMSAYQESKKRIIDLVKASHDWENTEGFIADGVICPDVYEQQSVRILCVLAESYGYDDSQDKTDIEAQGKKDVMGVGKSSVKSVRSLAAVLWLLQQSILNGSKIAENEMPRNLLGTDSDNVERLQDALSRVAWINVKKASRAEGTKMDAIEVRNHALRNKEILREQIKSIAPTLIIVGGAVVFRSMHEMELLGSSVQLAKKWSLQAVSGGPSVIEVTHPSPRNSDWRSCDSIYGVFECIYDQLAHNGIKPADRAD